MKTILLLFAALACCATAQAADRDILTPEPLRITDEAIASDIKAIQGVQKRLADLNNRGIPIASYHFAKSQAWLDFAMDEYTVNDRSRVVEEALRQALDIIEPLEKGEKGISLATPIIPTSTKVRPDLWEKAEAMKKDPEAFRCAGDKIAQLEVQLVWAGHEDRELGWRHSKPYLQAAERLAREADAELAACPPAPVAKAEKPATQLSAQTNLPEPAKTVLLASATGSAPVLPVSAASAAAPPAPAPVAPGTKPVAGPAPTAAVAGPAPAAPAGPITVQASPASTAAASIPPAVTVPAAPPAVQGTAAAAQPASAGASKPLTAVAAVVPAAPAPTPSLAEQPRPCPPCPACRESVPAATAKMEEPLPDGVHYALDRADLSDASKEVLDRVAAIMRGEPNLRVALYGHADQRGEALYNMKLSRQRAASVRAYLTAAGISPDRITVAAYGKSRPLILGRTIDGYARNRRVDLAFSVAAQQRTVHQDGDLQPEKLAR